MRSRPAVCEVWADTLFLCGCYRAWKGLRDGLSALSVSAGRGRVCCGTDPLRMFASEYSLCIGGVAAGAECRGGDARNGAVRRREVSLPRNGRGGWIPRLKPEVEEERRSGAFRPETDLCLRGFAQQQSQIPSAEGIWGWVRSGNVAEVRGDPAVVHDPAVRNTPPLSSHSAQQKTGDSFESPVFSFSAGFRIIRLCRPNPEPP